MSPSWPSDPVCSNGLRKNGRLSIGRIPVALVLHGGAGLRDPSRGLVCRGEREHFYHHLLLRWQNERRPFLLAVRVMMS